MIGLHRLRRISVTVCAILLSGAGALAQQDENFMPKGGKTLLLQIFGESDVASLREFLNKRRSEAEWSAATAARSKDLSERERQELVAYLAINLPVSIDAGQADRAAVVLALPPDGRELAWNQCQFCHSLFTSYLMHQRDVQGWRNIFLSPFHRRMKMTETERETFARYSAINMPMKKEDVPADLRY
jgi:hypothetical protein